MDRRRDQEWSEFIFNNLRLRTLPVAVKFLQQAAEFPDKTRRPSVALGKRITLCQAMTMARLYGWTVGVTQEDLICVPAMLAFGLTPAEDPMETLGNLFCQVDFYQDAGLAGKEMATMSRLAGGEFHALLFTPLQRELVEPDTVAIYGNPAQIMRLVQAVVYGSGSRVLGNFGGKVECSEYLIAPFKSQAPRVAIPGNGDRIFSMTQDDEMVLALPGQMVEDLVQGLKEVGRKIGARYPVTFYQNFQPEFPKLYGDIGRGLGLF
jgi:uncharacterized protein (DUF169 family)